MKRSLFALACGGVAALVACSSFDADPEPDKTPDGAMREAGPADVAAAVEAGPTDGGAGCTAAQPFVHVAPLATPVNGPRVLTGRLSADELTIYVTRVQDDGGSQYVNQRFERASFDHPWVAGPLFYDGDGLHTALTPTNDGTGVYFSYSGSSAYAMFFAPFGANNTLGPAVPIDGVPDPTLASVAPYPSADDTKLFFAHIATAGTYDLFEADRVGNTQIGNARPLGSINTTAIEANPLPSADGLTLYWSSNFARTNVGFRMASRATPAGEFAESTPIPGLGEYEDEDAGLSAHPIAISRDNCRLYFVSNIGSLVEYRIYVASRTP